MAGFEVATCLTVDCVWSMFIHQAMSQFKTFAVLAKRAWSVNKICDALPQKVHKVFFWHFEILAEMKTREKDL